MQTAAGQLQDEQEMRAGTGAFLEEMALRLRLPIEEVDGLARDADGEVTLGSYCTVFSATEVLEKIKAGHPVNRIVEGLPLCGQTCAGNGRAHRYCRAHWWRGGAQLLFRGTHQRRDQQAR